MVIPPISEKQIKSGDTPVNGHSVLNPVDASMTALDSALRSVVACDIDSVYVAAPYPVLSLVRYNIPDTIINENKKVIPVFWLSSPYTKNNLVDVVIKSLEMIYYGSKNISSLVIPTCALVHFANTQFDIEPYVETINKRLNAITYSSLLLEKDGKGFVEGNLLPVVLSNLDFVRMRRESMTTLKNRKDFTFYKEGLIKPYSSLKVPDFYDSNNFSEIFRYHKNNETFLDKLKKRKIKFVYKETESEK